MSTAGRILAEKRYAEWRADHICSKTPPPAYIKEFNIPFTCPKCGHVRFPLKPLGDKVFAWPAPKAEYVGKGIIYIPEVFRDEKDIAIILAIGPGYFNKDGVYVPTTLTVGQRVLYNIGVPWKLQAKDYTGESHVVKYMGERDIFGIFDNA